MGSGRGKYRASPALIGARTAELAAVRKRAAQDIENARKRLKRALRRAGIAEQPATRAKPKATPAERARLDAQRAARAELRAAAHPVYRPEARG